MTPIVYNLSNSAKKEKLHYLSIAADFTTAKQMGQRLPYPQVSTPNLSESHMPAPSRHESQLNKRYSASPSAQHKPPGHLLESLPPHLLPYATQVSDL